MECILILIDPRPLQPLQPNRLVAMHAALGQAEDQPGRRVRVYNTTNFRTASRPRFVLPVEKSNLRVTRRGDGVHRDVLTIHGLVQRGNLSTEEPVMKFLARFGNKFVVWRILQYWRDSGAD
jgi:hypothetical protein